MKKKIYYIFKIFMDFFLIKIIKKILIKKLNYKKFKI